MKLGLGELVPLAAVVVFFAAFGISAAGFAIALLPGFLFSYFLIECRKTVRILLSIPLSILLVLVPTWALNTFSFPVNGPVLVFMSVFYSVAFAALLKKSHIRMGVKSPFTTDTALLLVLVAAAVLITYPLHSGLLPRTDGSSHYYKTWEIRNSLDTGSIIVWDSGWYAGYALFDFYPPMSYYLTAFLGFFSTADLGLMLDYVMILSYVALAVGTFVLARELNFNSFSSFMAGFIVLISPRLATNAMFSGQFPTILAFSLVPLSVYVFIRAFNENKTRLYFLSGLLLGSNFLIHHLTGYFLATLLILVFVIMSAKHRTLKISGLVQAVATSVLVVAFWIIPFFVNISYSEYAKPAAAGFSPDVLLSLTTTPTKSCADFYCFEAMGLEFTLLAILGAILLFGGISVGKGKLTVAPKFSTGSVIAASMFVAVLVLALAPFIGITKFLPFGSSFGAERFTFYLILPIALLAGSICELGNGFRGKDFAVAGSVIVILLSLFLLKYAELANFRAADWNTESAPLDSSGLSDLYSELRTLPEGRVITYGIFQGAIVSAIPVQTGKGSISGWQPQSSPNYKRVAGKLEDISGQSLFNFNVSNRFVYTVYQQSWTRWIAINLCSSEGANAVNSTFARDDRYLFVWRNGNNQGCLVLLETPDTEFAESIKPVGVVNDEQSVKDSVYDTENGYSVYFTRRVSDIPQDDYKLVINRDLVWDNDLAEEIAAFASSEPKPLAWQRNGNSITVSNTSGWTIIKETYYPLWSAYNGNKKLDIYESDLGFMIVNSQGKLELKIERPVYYAASSAITLAFFVFVLFFAVSGKPASHNPDKEPDAVLDRP